MTQDAQIPILDPQTGLPQLPPHYIYEVVKASIFYTSGNFDTDIFRITTPTNTNKSVYAVRILKVLTQKAHKATVVEPNKNKLLAFFGFSTKREVWEEVVDYSWTYAESLIQKEVYDPLTKDFVPEDIKNKFKDSVARKKIVYDAREFNKELVLKHAIIAYKAFEERLREETHIQELEDSLLGQYPPKELK